MRTPFSTLRSAIFNYSRTPSTPFLFLPNWGVSRRCFKTWQFNGTDLTGTKTGCVCGIKTSRWTLLRTEPLMQAENARVKSSVILYILFVVWARSVSRANKSYTETRCLKADKKCATSENFLHKRGAEESQLTLCLSPGRPFGYCCDACQSSAPVTLHIGFSASGPPKEIKSKFWKTCLTANLVHAN